MAGNPSAIRRASRPGSGSSRTNSRNASASAPVGTVSPGVKPGWGGGLSALGGALPSVSSAPRRASASSSARSTLRSPAARIAAVTCGQNFPGREHVQRGSTRRFPTINSTRSKLPWSLARRTSTVRPSRCTSNTACSASNSSASAQHVAPTTSLNLSSSKRVIHPTKSREHQRHRRKPTSIAP